MSTRKKEFDMLRAFGLSLMVLQHIGVGGVRYVFVLQPILCHFICRCFS